MFVDQTSEQDFDTKWFVRSEPFACINPAPFFDRVRVVAADETIELRHVVAIADGASDASRMSAIAGAAGDAEAGGRRCTVVAASPAVERIFAMTGLSGLIGA